MEKNVYSPSLSTEKKFGYCKINWLIDNFSFQTFKKDWVIRSPEFIVNGCEETKWCMFLQPKSNIANYFVSFKVKRLDDGPEKVWIDLRMYFSGSDDKKFHSSTMLFSLKNESEYEELTKEIVYLLKKVKPFESDLLKITCEMIVYNKNASEGFKECEDVELKSLSETMLDLYISGKNYDVKLIIGDDTILAHKVVLCSRNELLSCLIEAEHDQEFQEYTTVDLSYIGDYKTMRKVLAYLYSGNLLHVLGEPSLSIHDCIDMLDISELDYCYKPDELTFKSSVDIQEFAHVLLINNSNSKNECDFKVNFETCHPLSTIELSFYSRCEQNADGSFCINFEGNVPVKALVQLALISESKHYVLPGLFFHKESVCAIKLYVPVQIMKHYSHSILKVILKIKLSTDVEQSFIESQHIYCASYFDEEIFYQRLSMDLHDALYEEQFSDVLIDNQGMHFPVHKCIIASRSSFFLDALEKLENGAVIIISNIDANILCVVLSYIYSGNFVDTDDDELIDVYKAAVALNLLPLKTICSDILQLYSETNVSIRCRTIKLAEVYEDKTLKECVLNHMFNSLRPFPVFNNSLTFRDVHLCRYC